MAFHSSISGTGISIPAVTTGVPAVDNVTSKIRPQDAIDRIDSAVKDVNAWAAERARVFDKWRTEKGDALMKWVMSNAYLFIEPPDSSVYIEVNPENYVGNPILYVNGMNTTKDEARDLDARFLSINTERPVYLLYNPTEGIPDDLAQCLYDKQWMPPAPQWNRTTKHLAYLLFHANGPLTLVTHSQGSIIAHNAIITMAWMFREKWIRESLAWLACGSPIWKPWITPKVYDQHTKPNDFVGQWIGMKGGNEWYKANRSKHRFVAKERRQSDGRPKPTEKADDYLEWVTARCDDIFIASTQRNPPSAPAPTVEYGRYVEFVNSTHESVDVSTYYYAFNSSTRTWNWINEPIFLAPGASRFAASKSPIARLYYRAKSDSSLWDHWSTEIAIVGPNGYKSSVGIQTTSIVLESENSSRVRSFKAFGVHIDKKGVERIWYGLPARVSFRQDRRGEIDVFERINVTPHFQTPSGQTNLGPFSSEQEIFNNYHGLFAFDSSTEIWFVPKSATGPVWIWERSGGNWKQNGFINAYVRPTSKPEWEGADNLDSTVSPTKVKIVLDSIDCNVQQGDVFDDNIEVRLQIDGIKTSLPRRRMRSGSVWKLNHQIEFKNNVEVELWDIDTFDPNDFLGSWTISPTSAPGALHFAADPKARYVLSWTKP